MSETTETTETTGITGTTDTAEVVKELDIKTLSDDYVPTIFKIPTIKSDILKQKPNPIFRNNIEFPNMALGFHHFIHQSKNNLGEAVKKFEGKKKVYLVLSKFERYIDNYDLDVNSVSKTYFDIDPKPNILSRAFFKLWEILMVFDLVPTDKKDFVSAHLAEGPGSFLQATMFYRDKFGAKGVSKNDKYYGVTLHAEKNQGINEHVPDMEEAFVKYYSKEKPQRVMIHKTYPTKVAKQSGGKDNGDLTDPKTIKLFGGNFNKRKADFITADGGFNWKNENLQEQEAFKLILAQIVTALRIQEKGGNFVCKIFESFTNTTKKFITILTEFYDEVYTIKPLMSRKSNSEKYLICLNFKFGSSKDVDKRVDVLESILADAMKNKDKNLVEVFPIFDVSKEFDSNILRLNTTLSNKQFQSMNEIIMFINQENYRGDQYQKSRQAQIEATKFWLDNFYPDVKDLQKQKKKLGQFMDSIVKVNDIITDNLNKQLI